MAAVDVARLLTLDEAAAEARPLMSSPYLHEHLSSLGLTANDFRTPEWGAELCAWTVSHVSLFRGGAFALHPARDPGASALYWMVRFLVRCYPGEDSSDFLRGARPCILAAAADRELALEAEKLAHRPDP